MKKFRLDKKVLCVQTLAIAVFLFTLFIIGTSATSQRPNVDGSLGSWNKATHFQFKPTKYQKLKDFQWQKVSNNTKRTRLDQIGWLVTFNEQAVTFVKDPTGSWKIYEDRRKKRRK